MNLEARDEGWQWHELDHMKIVILHLTPDR